MKLSYKVDGADNIIALMAEMGGDKGRKFALSIAKPGATELKKAIAKEAPVNKIDRHGRQGDHPGNLRKSVRLKAARARTGALGYIVGPFGAGSAHRHLVVGGHKIKGAFSSANHNRERGSHFLVSRGGETTRPNAFVQRGREQAQESALKAVYDKASSSLADLVKGTGE